MSDFSPEPLWPLQAELGEGPVWVSRDQALWFVDIKRKKIHRLEPVSGSKQSWDAPEQVGFALPIVDGGFIVGLSSGLYRFDPAEGGFTLISQVEPELPNNRLNDATVDREGRLWFGTMDNGERDPTGALYRMGRAGVVHRMGQDCAITNGPAVSADSRILYHVDTLAGVIHALDLDEAGQLSNRRIFVTIDSVDGHPDGVSMDSEDHVWVGLYGGWAARRYAPDGRLVETVRFPVANITKVAFGGTEMKTAFATTARHGLDEAAREAQPLAGALFSFAVNVSGALVPEVIIG